MKTTLTMTAILALQMATIAGARAQEPAAKTSTGASAARSESPLQKKVEAYLRELYAFGPETAVSVSPPKEIGVEGLLEVDIAVKFGGNEQTGKVYMTKDGKYMLRGEVSDLSKDPMAEARAQIKTKDSPSLGPADAPVTVVEFSDFECLICRSLHDILQGLIPKYPQVKVIFKDFPLEQIHPWARTAALAGRCAYEQDPKGFWKMYDLIYDNQDVISAENAWGEMTDFAGRSGLNADVLKACMASPTAGAAVDASRANGVLLEVNSTPTIFVNGRRIVGANGELLEQYIKYELDKHKPEQTARAK